MHVTILTQYFAPEIGAPQRRLGHLAQTFRDRGHRVTVLTAMPSYPRGKIYDGYGGLRSVEDLDGIRVIRTFIYPSQSARFLPRLANYFSFVASSATLGGWELEPCDYLMTESPPLFLGMAGFALSRWKRARWIFNVSDIWPESAVRVGVLRPGWMLSSSLRLEAFCYRKSWLVTGQSRSIIDNIQSRFPGVRTRLLSNGVDVGQFKPADGTGSSHAALHASARCVAFYGGLHGLAQGLDQIIEAAALLRDDGLGIFLMGDGPTKASLIEQARAASLANVHFLDPVPADQMPGWLSGADIAIVPLKMYIPGAVPSKLYEAMAAGLPVVLVATGEPADIVKEHRSGIAVEPGDVAGLARALQELARNPDLRRELGANGRRAVEQHFDRNRINSSFVEHLEQELATARGGR